MRNIVFLLAALWSYGISAASDHHAHHRAMMAEKAKEGNVHVQIHDEVLRDQDGREVRFKRDILDDRVVVMDFVYTTCTTVCPVLTALMKKLQDRLGERLGKDVFLVSVTVDPVHDTPSKLKAYASRHGAKAGWIWLTGEKHRVDKVLKGLGAYSADYTQHPAMVLVGDAGSGTWKRFYGFPSIDQIEKAVEALLAKRGQ